MRFSFVETRVQLADSLFQLFDEPRDFSILNLDKASKNVAKFPRRGNILSEFVFDLSNNIRIEKRQVRSIPELLAELGGLYQTFAIMCIFLIDRYRSKFFNIQKVKDNFKVVRSGTFLKKFLLNQQYEFEL